MLNAKLLKSKIAAAGMTQENLARLIGIKASTFSNKMTGRSQFTILEACLICEILGVNYDKEKASIFLKP